MSVQIPGGYQPCRKLLMSGSEHVFDSILQLCKSLIVTNKEPSQTIPAIQYPSPYALLRSICYKFLYPSVLLGSPCGQGCGFVKNLISHSSTSGDGIQFISCLYVTRLTPSFSWRKKLEPIQCFSHCVAKLSSYFGELSLPSQKPYSRNERHVLSESLPYLITKYSCDADSATSSENLSLTVPSIWPVTKGYSKPKVGTNIWLTSGSVVMHNENDGLNQPRNASSSEFYQRFYAYNRCSSPGNGERNYHFENCEIQNTKKENVIDLTESPSHSDDNSETVMSNQQSRKSSKYGPKRRSKEFDKESPNSSKDAIGKSQSPDLSNPEIQIIAEKKNSDDFLEGHNSRRRSPRRYGPKKYHRSSSKERETGKLLGNRDKAHTSVESLGFDTQDKFKGSTEKPREERSQSPLNQRRQSPRLSRSSKSNRYESELGEIQEIFPTSSVMVIEDARDTSYRSRYGPRRRSARSACSRSSPDTKPDSPDIQEISSSSLQSPSNFGPLRRSPRRKSLLNEFEQLEREKGERYESKQTSQQRKYGPQRRSTRGLSKSSCDLDNDGKQRKSPVSPEIIVLGDRSSVSSASPDGDRGSPKRGKRKRERQNSDKSMEYKKGKSSSSTSSEVHVRHNEGSVDKVPSRTTSEIMIDLTEDFSVALDDPAIVQIGSKQVYSSQVTDKSKDHLKTCGKNTGEIASVKNIPENVNDPAIVKIGPTCTKSNQPNLPQHDDQTAGLNAESSWSKFVCYPSSSAASGQPEYSSSVSGQTMSGHLASGSNPSEQWASLNSLQWLSRSSAGNSESQSIANVSSCYTGSGYSNQLVTPVTTAGDNGNQHHWTEDSSYGYWPDRPTGSNSKGLAGCLRRREWNSTPYRRNEYVNYSERRQSHFLEFTVASYNVLAQNLLEDHPHLYSCCPQSYLDWRFRSKNLLEEIVQLKPDVLCMQEVVMEHYYHFFLPELEKIGYKGVFKQKTGDKLDGCAIFFLMEKFELDAQLPVEYFYPRVSILDRDNVGLVVRLKVRDSKSDKNKIVVGTTHLLFNPRRGDIKLAQLMLLLSAMDQLACYHVAQVGEESYYPALLCGDFNSEPHSDLYKFVVRGSLKYEGLVSRTISGQSDCGWNDRYLPRVLIPPHVGVTDKCQFIKVVQSRDEYCSERKLAGVSAHNAEKSPDLNDTRESDVVSLKDCSLTGEEGDGSMDMDLEEKSESSTAPDSSPVVIVDDDAGQVTGTSDGKVEKPECENSKEMFPGQNSITEFGWPVKTADKQYYCQGSGTMSHRLELLSVYEHTMNTKKGRLENEVTTCHNNANCTLDYIFYSVHSKATKVKKRKVVSKNVKEGRLRLLSRLSLMPEKEMWDMGGLPNEAVSSDHLVLLAKFALKLK